MTASGNCKNVAWSQDLQIKSRTDARDYIIKLQLPAAVGHAAFSASERLLFNPAEGTVLGKGVCQFATSLSTRQQISKDRLHRVFLEQEYVVGQHHACFPVRQFPPCSLRC